MTEPNLFLVGAPKCGTTSVANYLAQHPEAFVCKPKEPAFFADDLRDRLVSNEREYFGLFRSAGIERWVCDASTDYLFSQNAIARISQLYPDARFIVTCRDHADMAFSLYQEQYSNGYEDVADFSAAWALCAARRAGHHIPMFVREPRRLDYQSRIRVGAQLTQLSEHVPRDRIFFIDFDVLKNETPRVFRSLCDFLGIDPGAEIDFSPKNLQKEVINPGSVRVGHILRSLKARAGIRRSFGVANWFSRRGKRTAAARREIPAAMREEIARRYSADRELLLRFATAGPGATRESRARSAATV